MTDRTGRAPSAFRLNLEQQKNRAKDLLHAAKSGDVAALARIAAVREGTTGQALKLADAQFVIARELRFPSWAKLKTHIDAMDRQRAAIDQREPALDSAVDEFPGGERYIGIGQLPAEAIRLLWSSRKPITPAQLRFGDEVWTALTSEDPRHLAALARSSTPVLPIMAPALHRHLRELPSIENGLGLTQHLALQILADGGGALTLNHLFLTLQRNVEPLPFITDLGFLDIIEKMLKVSEPVLTRVPAPPGERTFRQQLTITDLGRAVLRGKRDWHALRPPERWVGGVHVRSDEPGWRWDEARFETRLM